MSLPDPALQPEFYSDIPVKRSLAWAIDLVITSLLTLVALILTLFTATYFLPLIYTAVSIGYRTVMLSRHGATYGMMVMALEWRRLGGDRPDPLTAFVYSMAHAGMSLLMPLKIASMVTILLTPYRQGLHDLFFNTTMLHRAAPQ